MEPDTLLKIIKILTKNIHTHINNRKDVLSLNKQMSSKIIEINACPERG
jgi:hypothetical protein